MQLLPLTLLADNILKMRGILGFCCPQLTGIKIICLTTYGIHLLEVFLTTYGIHLLEVFLDSLLMEILCLVD